MTDPNQKPPSKARIIRTPTLPVFYVEGIAQMLVGFPNSRLMLSQLSQHNGDGGNQEDVHQIACELVVPTSVLIEMAQGILNNLGENKELLQNAGGEWMQRVISVIETLPATNTGTSPTD